MTRAICDFLEGPATLSQARLPALVFIGIGSARPRES